MESSDFVLSQVFSDLKPIEQYEGGPAPIAPIPYPKPYVEAMSYFRAVLEKEEVSERAFILTNKIIELSNGNYTAWYYKRKLLDKLNKPLEEEMKWLRSEFALDLEKNY